MSMNKNPQDTQKPKLTLDMIAQQRAELHQHGNHKQLGECYGECQRQHIGYEEVAVVHVGEDEGDPQTQQKSCTQNDLIGQLLALCKQPYQYDDHKGEGQKNANLRPQLDVHGGFVGEVGEYGGGVVV